MGARPIDGVPGDSVALVTGASGALGGVAARVLAARGLPVALHAHSHPDAPVTSATESPGTPSIGRAPMCRP